MSMPCRSSTWIFQVPASSTKPHFTEFIKAGFYQIHTNRNETMDFSKETIHRCHFWEQEEEAAACVTTCGRSRGACAGSSGR